jgi:predicted nucleic acid-binding protein
MSAKPRVLVDSSAWIFALRKDGIEHIRRRVDRLLDEDRVATCGLIVCELLGGTKSPKEFDRLERDLAAPHDLEITKEVWKKAAEINFTMARAGSAVPTADCVIAATAIMYEALLAHCDDHFDRISKKSHLKVESYVHVVRRIQAGG